MNRISAILHESQEVFFVAMIHCLVVGAFFAVNAVKIVI